jgi:TolA-binding protein
MNRKRFASIVVILFIVHSLASSQVPFTKESDFKRAMELYNKEKYPAAIRLFDSFLSVSNGNDAISESDAEFFRSSAALALFNPDAEYRMISFVRKHPESPRINEAYLALGDYFYQNKTYRKAVIYYELVNRQDLSPEKLPEYFFRLGYSLYIKGDKSRALLMFSEIKDVDTEYTPPAIYYFSQIAYEQQMYQTALEGFTRLKKDETFGSIVPFYIVQILYLQKDYDQILLIAPDLLKSAPKERTIELYRFIGDAFYNKGNYTEALPYLEKFANGTRISGREDKYQLGYCYYKTGDLDKAIPLFREIGARDDLLSQNIWYLLGASYLQKGDKKRAQLGFSEASKLNFDKKIQEEALFNYAKLTYETSYSPFGEVLAAFQDYIDQYPGSPRISEAYSYLVSTLLQVKNYKSALSALDKISRKDAQMEEAYQKVAFFRGLELFKNLEIEAASDMFDKSLNYGKYNSSLRARAVYWKSEALYRLGKYEEAKAGYTEFMGLPGSTKLSEYAMVRYNIGYTLFNLKDYSNAITHLKAFEDDVTKNSPEIIADARNRIADCYYITTSYPQAVDYYDKVIDFGKLDADYAMYQKSFSLGLMNNQKGKAEVLTLLMQRYPASSYLPSAYFERGRAYLVLEDYKKGESDFNSVISLFPESPVVPKAIVQLGLLYYNLGENDKAVAQYKKVIENFKSTPEARYALTGLKNAYVDMNDVDAYFSYVKSLQGYGDINLAEKDSLLYTSGENLYIAAKYDKAADVFQNYTGQFPNGSFLQNAKFYLAECLLKAGKGDDALKIYTEVANAPQNQFTEKSLIAVASILYSKEDYNTSYDFYGRLGQSAVKSENKLIALKGQLRSAYQMGDAKKTIDAANLVTSSAGLPEEFTREALFTRAKANYSLNNFDEALTDFRKVSAEVSSAEGAESKYLVADILYRKNQLDDAEKVITEFIDQNSPHQYWMARMFILLSDISLKKNDRLQSKATLESLRDNYQPDNDGILDEVKARLDSLNQSNNAPATQQN